MRHELYFFPVMYSQLYSKNIISIDTQTLPKMSLTPTHLWQETTLLYNLWGRLALTFSRHPKMIWGNGKSAGT
jgi:hypothetical protein